MLKLPVTIYPEMLQSDVSLIFCAKILYKNLWNITSWNQKIF